MLYVPQLVLNQHIHRLFGETVAHLLREGKAQEISVNADGKIRVDDGGPWEYLVDAEPIPAAFMETAIRLIAAANNIWIDPDAPFVDTVLACGARFSASQPPIADGVQFTIRTHARLLRPLTTFMTPEQADWTRHQINERENIIVTSGTNTGKTTLLNSIIAEISEHERLGIIEDVVELQLPEGRNVIRRLTSAKVSMKQHIRAMLRQRPDRIIVSEVRGEEAFDMVQAMLTGHSSCLSTVTRTPQRGRSPRSPITRITRSTECRWRSTRCCTCAAQKMAAAGSARFGSRNEPNTTAARPDTHDVSRDGALHCFVNRRAYSPDTPPHRTRADVRDVVGARSLIPHSATAEHK
jgi:type IV secretion system protein TrbB